MKMKMMAIVAMLAMIPTVAGANALTNVEDHVGVDRFAHAGCSYIIADQLHRAGMNRFWAGAATVAIGAAKEKWIDGEFDRGDFAADCVGVLLWQMKF
jgi:hypothetical protein